ncbi:MAG TPA: hypothetical protein VMM79_13095 [Longimicrobiales bacterium]|nr:hypothetical protein [Longimicrobiales bacterium]
MTGDTAPNTRALGDAIAALLNVPAQMAAALAGGVGQRTSPGCEIPPPCWEPRPAGKCCLRLTPGGTGTIRIRVDNCEWSRRVLLITAVGKIAGWLKFEPTTLVIDPQSSETFLVTVRVPANMKPGQQISGPVIVRGCNDHYVRIEVTVDECAGSTCCDIHIGDCADHIHHWYDHFYCPRPCRNVVQRDPKDG